jgi:small-conductance mechanosensitive channel
MKLDRLAFSPVWLVVALLLAPIPAGAALPGLPGEDNPRVLPQTSGVFDRETVNSARMEIEQALASVDSPQRRTLLLEQLDELERAEDLLDRLDNPVPLPALDPPFSLRDLDRSIERLRTTTERRLALSDAQRSAERALEQATRVLDDTRRNFSAGSAGREDVRLARERVRLTRFQLRNARMERGIAEAREERLARAVEEKRRGLRVTEEDLTERVAELESRRVRLGDERVQLDTEIERARSALSSALDDGAQEPRTDALRAQLAALERKARILDARDSDLAMSIESWTLRYRLAAGKLDSPYDENRAERRLSANLSELIHERDLTRAEIDRLRAEIQRLEMDRDREQQDERGRWIDARLARLTERLAVEADYAATLATQIADHRRYLEEFTARGVAGNVREGVAAVGETISNAWNFELHAVDDRQITVGKVVLALILFVAGVVISRILARLLRRRVFERMSMDSSLAASLQTLTLYVLVLGFFLTALRFVSIPLTALTFVGGALAIGVGFGSQNVVNNFISGLILMVERPIKVGDMIEVGGTYGKVERIGGRSTRVRSGNNTHIIVPNSTFLEKEVLNWTLSDKKIRTHVDVGVAYGSPTREVAKLLTRAVREHGQILDSPAPEVLFMNFGDNALEFRIYFWIKVRQILDRLRIQSDVRYKTDHLFREAGITIAFPQRDVHFDSEKPLQVRMIGDAPSEPHASGD